MLQKKGHLTTNDGANNCDWRLAGDQISYRALMNVTRSVFLLGIHPSYGMDKHCVPLLFRSGVRLITWRNHDVSYALVSDVQLTGAHPERRSCQHTFWSF